MQQEIYPVTFLSNTLPSLSSAKAYPEMLFFLETFHTALLQPNFLYFRHRPTDHYASLGPRADKHIDSSVKIIQSIRLHNYGILHLHLLGHQDISFASIIIASCFNDNYQIYISGLDKLEQKKVTAKVDFEKLLQRPDGFEDADIRNILDSLRKHFYMERFRQSVYSMPFFEDKMRDEIIRKAQKYASVGYLSNVGEKINVDDILLTNAVLIYEYWIKYEKIFQQTIDYLSQNKDQKKFYNAKLVFSLLFSSSHLPFIKQEMVKLVSFEEQEVVDRVKNTSDLTSFLSSFFMNSDDEDIKNKVQYAIMKYLFSHRLKSDAGIFKTALFIDQLTEPKIALNHDLVEFADSFYEATFLSDAGFIKIEDKLYVSDAANRVFATNFVNLFMHSKKFSQIRGMTSFEYSEYAKEVKKFLDDKVFYVDNIVVNSIMQNHKNSNLVISKTLDKTQIEKTHAQKILLLILKRLNKHYEKIITLRQVAKVKQKGEKTKIVERQMLKYSKQSINILPRLDYILQVQQQNPASEEKTIFRDAKKCLGLMVFNDDYTSIKNYHHKIGYSKLMIPSIHDLSELESIDPAWLYDIYVYFVESAVYKHLNEVLHSDLAFLKDKYFNRFDYMLNRLASSNIFLGYDQLKDILLKYKNWNLDHLNQLGYRHGAGVNYKIYNPLLDYKNWLIDKNNSNKPSHAQNAVPVFNSKFSIQDYCNYQYSFWQKHLDSFLTPKTNNKRHTFLARFFQNITNKDIFNVFSEEATNLIPDNDWHSVFKFDLQHHFKNELEYTKETPKYILIRLAPKYHFVSYFFNNFAVESGDSLVPVIFHNSYSEILEFPGSNWHWEAFTEKIQNTRGLAIDDMQNIWNRFMNYQQIYQGVVNAASLIILMDMVSRYLKPKYKKVQNIMHYKQMHDSDKLIIYSGRVEDALLLLNSRQQKDSVMPIAQVSAKFYEYNQAEADKFKIAKNLKDINQQLSKIPYIKYAPRNLKIFRLNIKQIEELLTNKILSLDENDLKKLISMVYDSWVLYTKIVEQEASYPYKYRYLHIAFSSNISRVGKLQNQDMINFFRATYDFKNNKKTARNFLLSRMYEAVIFKGSLTNKKYFLICGRQFRTSELLYLLESIRIVKGMEADILIDDRIEEAAKQDILAYVNPDSIISFRVANT